MSSKKPLEKIVYGNCAYCGKELYKKNKKYCNKRCGNKAKMKIVNIPPRAKLEKLLLKYSLTKIGQRYGVSAHTVKKWCDKRKVNCSREYIKQRRNQTAELLRSSASNQPKHFNYLSAPVQMAGKYKHNQEFENIYQAVQYVKRNRWTKASEKVILSSIKRVILGERHTYLSCTWSSPAFVSEHNNSNRCTNIIKKEGE